MVFPLVDSNLGDNDPALEVPVELAVVAAAGCDIDIQAAAGAVSVDSSALCS